MTRRHFLIDIGLGAGFVIGGARFLGFGNKEGISYAELPKNIRPLCHEDFARAVPALLLDDLIAELSNLGV